MSAGIKIKIAHLSSVHFALDTRIFYRMCRTLAAEYDVTLIAVHPKKEEREGVRIIPFRRYHNRGFRVFFGWWFMFLKAISVNARIYHLHDPELIPCGLLLKMFGKQVIWDVHENIAEDIFDKPWIRHQRRAYNIFHFFEKLACRYFTIILAEKSYEKRYHGMAKQCYTVMNFCDTDFFEPYVLPVPKTGKGLFYIGIILENRGILQIAEVLQIAKQKGEVLEFHCVGELYTDLERKLKALPYYNEIRDQLHFYGRLPLDEGYKIAAKCSVGLCIIWPMKNSVESYPTKIFEYMAIGLPVVTSDFPLYRSVVGENGCGICVNPMKPFEIFEAIEAIHRDVEKSEQMTKQGKMAVRNNFRWQTESLVLTKVYRDMAAGLK